METSDTDILLYLFIQIVLDFFVLLPYNTSQPHPAFRSPLPVLPHIPSVYYILTYSLEQSKASSTGCT